MAVDSTTPIEFGPLRDNGGAVYNVKHRAHGVTGGGTTDDTSAINTLAAAVDTAGGGTLYFPPGTYLFSGELNFYSGQRWEFAPGAKLKLADGAVSSLSIHMLGPDSGAASDVEFVNLHIDGNRTNNASTTKGDGLSIAGVTNGQFTGLTIIENCTRDGVQGGNTTDGGYRNIHFDHLVARSNGVAGVNGGNGVSLIDGRDITFDYIHCKANYQFGFNVETNPSVGADKVVGVTVNGGLAEATETGPGVQVYAGDDLSIRGVNINNVISKGNGTYGFSFYGASTFRSRDVFFNNCAAEENDQHGFYSQNQNYGVFNNCRAYDNSQSTADTYSGFFVHRSGLVFRSCEARDRQGTPTQKYGFEEDTGADNNRFYNCAASGNATDDKNIVGGRSSWGPAEDQIFGTKGLSSLDGVRIVNVNGVDRYRIGANLDRAGTGRLDTSQDCVFIEFDVRSTNKRLLIGYIDGSGTTTMLDSFGDLLGFYGATAVAKPEVTGSRGGNAALASLLTALETLGLVTDSST